MAGFQTRKVVHLAGISIIPYLLQLLYKTSGHQLIESSTTVKDLGVTFCSNLTFDIHIGNIVKKANSKAAWVLSLISSRSKNDLLFLYKTYVRSNLEYCCPLWHPSGPNSMGNTKKLEGVQRSFTSKIQTIQHLNYWQRLKFLNLMSLQRRRERYIIIYMWKILNGLVPNDMKISFYTSQRDCIKAKLPQIPQNRKNLSMYDKSYSVLGPKLWNTLPTKCTLALSSLEDFKSNLDTFLQTIPDLPPVDGYFSPHSNSLIDPALHSTNDIR